MTPGSLSSLRQSHRRNKQVAIHPVFPPLCRGQPPFAEKQVRRGS
jgi:hypothetical protein